MLTTPPPSTSELATLGGGCFWCLEAVFEQLKGVSRVVSGYAGGKKPNPTYEEVCSGRTGHAEVVQITFDPSIRPFRNLLQVFFAIHDPTTLNRQGADVGTQYRSVIFFHASEQEKIAREVISQLDKEEIYPQPAVTEVVPLPEFYPAEEYHQGYFRQHPNQGYCQAVISPKLSKFRKQFLEKVEGGG